jgi:hypothetical protein
MILYPLKFEWRVSDEHVKFSVVQNPAHIIHERYYSRGRIPPIGERVKYARYLGTPEKVIRRMVKTHKLNIKNSEKNQIELDAIFARFNVKPTKKKVLKPVKKVM